MSCVPLASVILPRRQGIERNPAAPSDEQILKELTGKLPTEHFWTSRVSAARGARARAERIQVYLKDKQLWPEGV